MSDQPKDELRVSAAEVEVGEEQVERSLRPRRLADYIGQEKIKQHLAIFMAAAKSRREPMEHILLHGSPGLGKTTLANVIASEMNVQIRITSGPALERAGDLAAILTNLADHDILFIDEIHRLPRVVEEVLYPAMEDYALDIVLGKGPSAKTLRLDLPHFTLIGATTRVSLLSAPLRDRFGVQWHLDFYGPVEIEQILDRSAAILQTQLEVPARVALSTRARATPRVANRLLKRVRDFAQVRGNGIIDAATATAALALLEIDGHGLDAHDRALLQILVDRFGGGPAGLQALAAASSEEMQTIEDVYEPFLLQQGFLARTARGRVATEKAYRHLGLTPPADLQSRLI